MVRYNNSHTRCKCSHLTNFAVLMQVKMFQTEKVHVVSLEILTKIGCCISIAALTTTIAVLLWLRLRSDRYYLLLHLSVAVIIAQVVFLLGIDAVQFKIACRFVAILLHYLYLSVLRFDACEGNKTFPKNKPQSFLRADIKN
ncbi:adhesion G-protein coupled receptor D1-like [Ruditapes philippinarum]|uniref:adhesion G-protein coupled receptor D1-like n=1 Tax=Ruditapes philippinarum TaxID=129788 RepID=UPI00295BE0E6|nr:adhesion G-protein coupled receptor D1-like [Ruditapes philippinarum]